MTGCEYSRLADILCATTLSVGFAAALVAQLLHLMASLPGTVTVSLGRNDLPVVSLATAAGAQASVHLHGAHVTSWKTPDGTERLFMSSASAFEAGTAIRGGVPVCWPQFAGRGPLGKHGFARTSEWTIDSMSSSEARDMAEVQPPRCTHLFRPSLPGPVWK